MVGTPSGGDGRPGPSGAAYRDEDDHRLLQRHVAGEPEAFGELVRRHGDRLWAVALRTLGDPDDAADALQEAVLSAYRRAGSYRGEAAVTTWLHRIVVNACLDAIRRQKVRPVQPLPVDYADPGPSRDPIEDRQTRLDVATALARLPVEQQVAIILVDVEGYPVAEVAGMLGVPSGTVKSRCARGRARLAAVLAGYRNRSGTADVPPRSPPEPGGPPTRPAPPAEEPGEEVER